MAPIADIGIWSFGGKTLTTGAGGMLMTNNEDFARRASNFVRKGSEGDIMFRSSLAPEPEPVDTRGYAAFLGTTYAMTDLEAARGPGAVRAVGRTPPRSGSARRRY